MGLRNLAQHSFVPSSQLRAAVRNEGDFLQVLAQPVGLKYGHNGHTDINGHSSIIYYHYCVRISAIDTA